MGGVCLWLVRCDYALLGIRCVVGRVFDSVLVYCMLPRCGLLLCAIVFVSVFEWLLAILGVGDF